MPFRVFYDGRDVSADTIQEAFQLIQFYAIGLHSDDVPVCRWWGQITRESDGMFRVVWFDKRGACHCSPWLSD